MMSKVAILAALAGSAAAYAPTMSMGLSRRQTIQTGAAAAAVVPFLRNSPASAEGNAIAPVITVFDHRGCQRGAPDTEYKGLKAKGPDDEMCVKLQMSKISVSKEAAVKALQEFISFNSKGINSQYTWKAPK